MPQIKRATSRRMTAARTRSGAARKQRFEDGRQEGERRLPAFLKGSAGRADSMAALATGCNLICLFRLPSKPILGWVNFDRSILSIRLEHAVEAGLDRAWSGRRGVLSARLVSGLEQLCGISEKPKASAVLPASPVGSGSRCPTGLVREGSPKSGVVMAPEGAEGVRQRLA